MTPRNANLVLAVLRESGELVVRQNKGPRGTNLYKITLKNSSPLKESSPLKNPSSTPEEFFPKPLKNPSDEPSVNHQEPPKKAYAHTSSIRKHKGDFTLSQFLDQCKASGQAAVPDSDPIFDYADKVGITEEMMSAAWAEFRAAHLSSDKTYKDWRQSFSNAVRRNWYKLWFLAEGQPAAWTTAGEQARRAAA